MNKCDNKRIFLVGLFEVIFILTSLILYLENSENRKGEHSSKLAVVIETNDIYESEIFVDTTGKITFASDKQYAVKHQYYDSLGRIKKILYYDEFGNPSKQVYGSYGLLYDYIDDHIFRVTYLDETERPMFNSTGYVSALRFSDEKNNVVLEKYYDMTNNIIDLHAGYCAARYEYDSNNRQVYVEYLDQDNKPVINNQGYSCVKRTFYKDGSINSEFFLDTSGNPVKLSKGQYGIKRIGKMRFYLDKRGKIIISIENITNNFPWITIIISCIIVFIVACSNRKVNNILFILYFFFIIFETLAFRKTIQVQVGNYPIFWSYKLFYSDFSVRKEILDNIFLFVPFGVILYNRYNMIKSIAMLLMVSSCIEICQFILRIGICELDDVFSNVIGGIIGMFMIYVVNGKMRIRILL